MSWLPDDKSVDGALNVERTLDRPFDGIGGANSSVPNGSLAGKRGAESSSIGGAGTIDPWEPLSGMRSSVLIPDVPGSSITSDTNSS